MTDELRKPSTIAIDGPAASGKTTLALALATELGYLYFDTGVMYRAVTLAALREKVDLRDAAAVAGVARSIQIDVIEPTVEDGRASTVLLDGEDVTWDLRTAEVDECVSIPSSYPDVRAEMTRQQRRIAERGRVVMVGRDIGTVVLPDADLKLYLDASVEARARRRWQDYLNAGHNAEYEDILASMRARDMLDSQRAVAPLRPADDAVVIDNTSLAPGDVLAYAFELIEAWGERHAEHL
jgi:cytidylate kinase